MAIPLAGDAASTYNPYGAPAASFGAAAKAVAGNPRTSWTYKLDPRNGGVTKVGLAIAVKPARTVTAISLTTGSPGMAVEFYGTAGPLPTSITDPAWKHLGGRESIDPQARVALRSQDAKFDYVLVWITHAPPLVNAGVLSLAALSLAS